MSPASPTDLSDRPPGTFAPDPGAAPLRRMVLAQGRIEAILLLRNGEQVLLSMVIPLLLLVAGVLAPGIDLGTARRIDVLAPGVLALAVMSTAFTSLAITTGFERRYGVLKRLGVSPLPRSGLLAGKAVAVLVVEMLQVVAIVSASLGLGWRPSGGWGGVAAAALLLVAGTAAFASLGLLLAGVLRAEATLAGANLVYVLLLVGGATLVPITEYPTAVQGVLGWLPSGALAEGLREVFAAGGPGWSVVAGSFGVLALWAFVGAVATARTFRWD